MTYRRRRYRPRAIRRGTRGNCDSSTRTPVASLFLLLEGSFAIAALMALAEFVNWWAVILLPLTVAIFVKINDVVAGVFSRPDLYRRGRTTVLRPVIWACGVGVCAGADRCSGERVRRSGDGRVGFRRGPRARCTACHLPPR